MKLKSIVVALAAIIVSVSSAIAQQHGSGQMDCKEMAKRRTENLKKAVKLDESQEKKANEIYLKYCEESKKARENQDRDAAVKIREKVSKEIDAILTPEQQKLWKAEQEKSRRGGNGNGNRGRK